MKNKLEFLQFEDTTVALVKKECIQELRDVLPSSWHEIVLTDNNETTCQAAIGLWQNYLGGRLPNVLNQFQSKLKNVDFWNGMLMEQKGILCYTPWWMRTENAYITKDAIPWTMYLSVPNWNIGKGCPWESGVFTKISMMGFTIT